jgi:hypothetical protein
MAPSLYEFQSILALGEIALRGRASPTAQRTRAGALQMSAFMGKTDIGKRFSWTTVQLLAPRAHQTIPVKRQRHASRCGNAAIDGHRHSDGCAVVERKGGLGS